MSPLAKRIYEELQESDWVNIRVAELLEKADRIRRKVESGLVYKRVRRGEYTAPARRARFVPEGWAFRLVRPDYDPTHRKTTKRKTRNRKTEAPFQLRIVK